jgi:hypothetical protein
MVTRAARNEAMPPARRAAPVARIPGPRQVPVPDIRPRAGYDLLVGVDAVLPKLSVQNGTALADDLRTALARTSARGDTCRVHHQAETVRAAVDLLLAGSIDEARTVLLRVRTELS